MAHGIVTALVSVRLVSGRVVSIYQDQCVVDWGQRVNVTSWSDIMPLTVDAQTVDSRQT